MFTHEVKLSHQWGVEQWAALMTGLKYHFGFLEVAAVNETSNQMAIIPHTGSFNCNRPDCDGSMIRENVIKFLLFRALFCS
jgi:hypothetical protein